MRLFDKTPEYLSVRCERRSRKIDTESLEVELDVSSIAFGNFSTRWRN